MEKISGIMSRLKIFNGNIITPFENLGIGTVLTDNGKITAVERGNIEVSGYTEVDAKNNYITPGFIDLHTHGGGGSDFMDSTTNAFITAANMHAKHGTTLLFPTTLAGDNLELYSFFDTYEKALPLNTKGARFGGIHLEGPYFSYNHRGAQDPKYLRNPNPTEYNAILERSKDIVRWSIAPELPGSTEFAHTLTKRGILPSIAHTDAIYEEILEAFKAGFTHITHFYSCMNGITRRNAFRYAGCIEAGYLIDEMTVEIIADGIHVPEPLMKLIYRLKGAENIALVTDSMRGAGMPDGESILGSLKNGQSVIIEDGVAKLIDRTAFAGSVATADLLVRNARDIGGTSLKEAVRMATSTPARIANIGDKKGRIAVGYDADIVIFNDNIEIQSTIIDGEFI
ncbi:MAG: N-acetylglucosamine-6-phosphate deacetylase [Bacteroidetes bacterium GWF2_41_61]|nr:MAG: N-acetylglucosamine-6-phosphate deacetylase [Bacteroidetes bacterium GWF2_41_61]HBG23465.1 N-acetylglucosamine-6-phosphate deacetylase [Rikenellaceae bacterium]